MSWAVHTGNDIQGYASINPEETILWMASSSDGYAYIEYGDAYPDSSLLLRLDAQTGAYLSHCSVRYYWSYKIAILDDYRVALFGADTLPTFELHSRFVDVSSGSCSYR